MINGKNNQLMLATGHFIFFVLLGLSRQFKTEIAQNRHFQIYKDFTINQNNFKRTRRII